MANAPGNRPDTTEIGLETKWSTKNKMENTQHIKSSLLTQYTNK
jgi:hypothetical protein